MDFQLSHDNLTGTNDQTFTPAADILNNIILSLAVVKGTWWHDRSFGMARRLRLKNTPASLRLIKQDAEEALQWLLVTGRATRIDVTATRPDNDLHRVQLQVLAYQADGRIINYTTFKGVV